MPYLQKVEGTAALCVAARRDSAGAGAAALRAGGNAFDAIVAAGFMEAVIAPAMCGIGGYAATGVGFLARSNRLVALDANAVAPRAASPTMFPVIPARDPNRYTLPGTSRHRSGPLSVAVPRRTRRPARPARELGPAPAQGRHGAGHRAGEERGLAPGRHGAYLGLPRSSG